MDIKSLEKTAAEIRCGIIKAIHNAGSGHPGGSLSAADIVTALYFDEMNVDPKDPKMKGRDKFILSKGHAGPVQYSALAVKGYYPMEDFMTLRKLGSKFQGHPDMHKVPGIEMSTGSLGQGISAADGMALANKLDNDPGRIYVLLGDGEIQEGIVWEALMSAAHYKLDNMVAILDHNGLQIDGKNEDVMTVAPVVREIPGIRLERDPDRRTRLRADSGCVQAGESMQGQTDHDRGGNYQGEGRFLYGKQCRMARQGAGRGTDEAGTGRTGR